MPIRVSSIPYHIQLEIIGKLNVEDFMRLQISSKDASNLSKKLKTLITVPREITDVINFNCRDEYLNEDVGLQLVEYFNSGGSTYGTIHFFRERGRCSSTCFYELLKASNVNAFMAYYELSSAYYSHIPATIRRIDVPAKDIEDKDLLNTKTEVTYLNLAEKITGLGLNAFFKEWAKGSRKIEHLHVKRKTDWEPETKEHILNGFDYSKTSVPNVFAINNGSQVLHIDFRKSSRIGAAVDPLRLETDPYGFIYLMTRHD